MPHRQNNNTDFSLLPSYEGRRAPGKTRGKFCSYFNPLPSCEGRRSQWSMKKLSKAFQSTPLMRGETRIRRETTRDEQNFNPLPSREGRREVELDDVSDQRISIRSPHARGDKSEIIRAANSQKFQSAPLTRGETSREELLLGCMRISIRSPHARGDFPAAPDVLRYYHFNPLPSCEGRPSL